MTALNDVPGGNIKHSSEQSPVPPAQVSDAQDSSSVGAPRGARCLWHGQGAGCVPCVPPAGLSSPSKGHSLKRCPGTALLHHMLGPGRSWDGILPLG